MADYSAKIDALETAVGSGELTVESDGDRVTYRNMDDLMRALDYFRAQQAASASGVAQRLASTVAVFDPR